MVQFGDGFVGCGQSCKIEDKVEVELGSVARLIIE